MQSWWVWCFNHHRLLKSIDYVAPAEHEEAFYRRHEAQTFMPALTSRALRKTRVDSPLALAGMLLATAMVAA